jgi:hypothetical protein
MEYQGHVAGGVIVLDNGTDLPEGTVVRVEPILTERPATVAERFKNVIGRATGLPEDMAAQHDHYIHGAPKK